MRFPRPAPAGLLAVALVVPTAVVLPALTTSPPTPHPVAAKVQQVSLRGVDVESMADAPAPQEIARRESAARPVVLTAPERTSQFRMMGVSWRGAAPSATSAVLVSVRTHTDGAWTEWTELHALTDAGTEASPNGRFATVPYWTGDSDGVQVRVDAVGGVRPRHLRADLIEPGTSEADALVTDTWNGSTAAASTDRPPIVTRAEWGADESLRDKRLENNDTIEVGFVHHTAGSNDYSRSESPAVVRGLYSYYVNTLGYADMGYNFLVDKYGTIYEGRAGSITLPVRAAATGGFNTNTMAVVAMGNFETATASDAMVQSIAKVLAYRLSRYHHDPYDTTVLTAEVGSSRYSAGEKATFKVVSGHRDAGFTACPGQKLYNRMDDIRRLTREYMGSSLIEPSVSTNSVEMGSPVDIKVRAGVLQQQSWTLTVRDFCTGDLVRRLSGSASASSPIRTSWRGLDDQGKAVPPGRYRLTLTSSGNGTTAWPFERSVTIGVGGRAASPTLTSLGRTPSGTYVATAPRALLSSTAGVGTRTPLILGPDRRLDVQVLGRAGVPSSGVSAVALSVEADCASAATRVSVSPDTVQGKGAQVVSVGAGGTARGFTIVRVGPGGGIRFHNAHGAVGVKASVVGYVSTEGAGGTLTPVRRTPLGVASPMSVSTSPVSVDVAGRAGVPADARAVVLAVRRGGDSPVGAIWAWAGGTSRPNQPLWRRPRGTGAVSQVIVPLGPDGSISVAADRSGSVSWDVAGYVAASDTRGVHPVVPTTVTGTGARLDAGEATTVSVAGRAGVPTDATAVVVQLSGSTVKSPARLMIWPRGAIEPTTADVVVPARSSRDSTIVLRLGDGGDLRIRARDGAATANLQVVGWIR